MHASTFSHEIDHLIALRRRLHRHPELAFNERETAAVVMRELQRLNVPFEYSGVGSGVIARIETDPALPTVALRAELDALPGHELTKSGYCSLHPEKVHACGHDAHMAILLGAAARLVANPPAGNVVLIFQPAEESGGGARTMIKAGALNGVAAIFGGHVTHDWEAGAIMVKDGAITAQSDRLRIEIRGEAGHGARPHEAIDAVVIAGLLICTIQTLISRAVNPLHPSVITIGKITAGTAPNVIAEEAVLEGSIRSTVPQTREHIHRGLARMAEAMGELHGANIKLDVIPGYPPVINTPLEVSLARTTVKQQFGDDSLVGSEHPSMGSEDFSYYLDEVPGCFVRFGARPAGWEPIPLHSPSFDIDEQVLLTGARYYESLVHRALDHYGSS